MPANPTIFAAVFPRVPRTWFRPWPLALLSRWLQIGEQRRELLELDDMQLSDIGISNRIHTFLSTFTAAAAVALAALSGNPAVAEEADPAADVALVEGVRHYMRGEYPQAIQRLQVAAEHGDDEAAEIIGFMHLVGERLYGPGVPVDLPQARKWLHIAAIKGSRAAKFALRPIVAAWQAEMDSTPAAQ